MIPRTKKLFISYRSSDAVKVDKIARDLSLLKYEDGTARYIPWQDKKNLPPASPNWWDAIVDAIIDCDVFVFHLSEASLQSKVCRAELDYAHRRNRPIVPIVLEGEFFLDADTGKYDINYWHLVPEWLGNAQFLFYTGTEFYKQFQTAITLFEHNWPPDVDVRRPLNPDSESIHGNNHAVYGAACDYAARLAFDEAEKHFSTLLRRNDADYADIAVAWLTILDRYKDLLDATQHGAPRVVFQRKWDEYVALFPLDFVDDLYPDAHDQPIIFDPSNLSKGRHQSKKARKATTPSPQDPLDMAVVEEKSPTKPTNANEIALQRAQTFAGKRNRDWEPYITTFDDLKTKDMPFCLVPVGTFNMGSDDGHYKDEQPVHSQRIEQPYWIAQFPVTNAQWKMAVQAGAVKEPYDTGSALKWYRDKVMAGAPVVGVDWFMARDFAAWVGCRLPSEMEWEYAARGVESLRYPWGDDWRPEIPVWDKNSGGKPADVTTRKEGKSWVAAWHMIGNVWEWTSSLYEPYPYSAQDGRERDTGDSTNVRRVLRGASWRLNNVDNLRAACRVNGAPDIRDYDGGFRLARSYK